MNRFCDTHQLFMGVEEPLMSVLRQDRALRADEGTTLVALPPRPASTTFAAAAAPWTGVAH